MMEQAEMEKLETLSREEFFKHVYGNYSGDPTTERMEAAIKVLERRFPEQPLNEQITWFLYGAAGKGNIPMMEYLVGLGALAEGTDKVMVAGLISPDLWAVHADPLYSAVVKRQGAAVRFLLETGRIGPEQSVLVSASTSTPEIMRMLLKSGMRREAGKALAVAILQSNYDIADVLTAEGVPVDAYVMRSTVAYALHPDNHGGNKQLEYLADHGGRFEGVAKLDKDQIDAGKLRDFTRRLHDRDRQRAFNIAAQRLAHGAGKMIAAPEKAAFARKKVSAGLSV